MPNKPESNTVCNLCHYVITPWWLRHCVIMSWRCVIGLSFGRSYLIRGLNLMIAKSLKTADFSKICRFWDRFYLRKHRIHWKSTKMHQNPWIFAKNQIFTKKPRILVDFGLEVVKLTNSFHSRVRTRGGHINFFPWNLLFFNKICGVFFIPAWDFSRETSMAKRKTIFAWKDNPYI